MIALQRCDGGWFHLRTLVWLFLWALVAVMVGIVAGASRWSLVHEPGIRVWLAIALLVGAAGVASYVMWQDRELLRGILVLAVAIAAFTAAIVALIWLRETWIWMQFLIVITLVVVALVAIAPEWTRRWLLGACVVFAALIAGIVVRVGYQGTVDRRLAEPVEQAITDRATLFQQFEEKGTTRSRDDIEGEQERAVDDLTQRVNDVGTSERLSGEGTLLIAELGTPSMGPRLDRLLLIPADQSGVDAALVATLRTSAQAAADAYLAIPTDITTPALDEALVIACRVVNDVGVEPPSCAALVEGEPVPTDPLPETSDALHRLAFELAAYRAKVTESDADKTALQALAESDAKDLEISLLEAVAEGPEMILASTGHNSLRPIPGPAGWAILALVVVFGLRQLVRLNAAQVAGPVRVDHDEAHLRVAVMSNLDAPGTAPDTTTAQSITDLAALVDPSSVGKAFAVLTNALAPPQGYVVSAEVAQQATNDETPPPKDEKSAPSATTAAKIPKIDAAAGVVKPPVTVLVRITTVAGNATIDSSRFDDPDPVKAMQSAGYWVAGTLLARSTRIPTWAAWNQQTAESLATASAQRPTSEQLEQAVQSAPNSGILLLGLAYGLQLEGKQLAALLMYSRCVEAHPRYLLARYRLAVAIGMFARDLDANWNEVPAATKRTALDGLSRAAQRIGLKRDTIDKIPDLGQAKVKWWAVAREFLERSVDDLRRSATVVAALRRSERDVVHRPNRSDPERRHRRWRLQALARSAILAYPPEEGTDAATRVGATRKRVERDLGDRRAGWQLLYNDACQKSAANPTEALRSLERCLAKPGSGQLTRKWAETDPDLKVLAGHPRFTRFLDQLGSAAT